MNEWQPTYPAQDTAIEMTSASCTVMTTSNHRPTLFISGLDHPYNGHGAFFWNDESRFLLRFDWDLWLPVSIDNSAVIHDVKNGRIAILTNTTDCSPKDYTIPIHRLYSPPEDLFSGSDLSFFGRQESPPIATGTVNECPSDASATNNEPTDDSAGTELDKEAMNCKRISILTRNDKALLHAFRKYHPVVYPPIMSGDACIQTICIGRTIHAFVLCPCQGTWLANEDVHEPIPHWFNEESDVQSPIHIARSFRTHLKKRLHTTPKTAVVFDANLSLINDADTLATMSSIGIVALNLSVQKDSPGIPVEQYAHDLMTKGNNELPAFKPSKNAIRQAIRSFTFPQAD